MKKKALICGSGRRGRQLVLHLLFDYEILGFVETIDAFLDRKSLEVFGVEYRVFAPQELNFEYDCIFLADFEWEHAFQKLLSCGIEASKIDQSRGHFHARVDFVANLAEIYSRSQIKGSVAEVGVYRGELACFINACFERDFYLFDTFEGFCDLDCQIDKQMGFSHSNTQDFSDTSLEFVQSKMPNPKRCHFIKGYFPETTTQVPKDEQFCFVSIDTDLYKPILDACEFFYPRLCGGGAC